MKTLQKVLATALSLVLCAAMLPANAAAMESPIAEEPTQEELIYFLPEQPLPEEPIYFLPEPFDPQPTTPIVTTPHFVSYEELRILSVKFLGAYYLAGWVPYLEEHNANPDFFPEAPYATRANLAGFVPKDELEKMSPSQLCAVAKQIINTEAYQRLHASMELLGTSSGCDFVKATFTPEEITQLHDEIYYAATIIWPNGCPELCW